jgi:hypothetical protein
MVSILFLDSKSFWEFFIFYFKLINFIFGIVSMCLCVDVKNKFKKILFWYIFKINFEKQLYLQSHTLIFLLLNRVLYPIWQTLIIQDLK